MSSILGKGAKVKIPLALKCALVTVSSKFLMFGYPCTTFSVGVPQVELHNGTGSRRNTPDNKACLFQCLQLLLYQSGMFQR